MNITEREIDDPEKEGVILEYENFTKDYAEIKGYIRKLRKTIRGYTKKKYSYNMIFNCFVFMMRL